MKLGIIQMPYTDYFIDTDETSLIGRCSFTENSFKFFNLEIRDIDYERDDGFEDEDGEWVEEINLETRESYEEIDFFDDLSFRDRSRYIPVEGSRTSLEGTLRYGIIKIEFEED